MKREPRITTPKQPYRSPKLVVHGDLTALTKSKGGTGQDGGSGKPNTRQNGAPS